MAAARVRVAAPPAPALCRCSVTATTTAIGIMDAPKRESGSQVLTASQEPAASRRSSYEAASSSGWFSPGSALVESIFVIVPLVGPWSCARPMAPVRLPRYTGCSGASAAQDRACLEMAASAARGNRRAPWPAARTRGGTNAHIDQM
jgi:hypothetical protein